MALVDRVRNICVSPTTEWPVIEQENTPPAELVTGYLLPLAAIGAVAGVIGGTIIGATVPFVGTYRTPLLGGLVSACVGVVMTVVGCFLIAFVVNALAPRFGGRQDWNQAFKVSVYSYTPGLVAGVLRILPMLSILISVIAGLYGLYLLYLGLPQLMKAPRDKAVAYTIVVVIASIVVMWVVTLVVGLFAGVGMMGAAAL
jgi:hypothetical protein